MEAIVLAGGFGRRLRQVVPDVPKPMAPIGGRPFLELLLRSLARKGFSRIILSVGYMAEQICGYFGGSFAGMDLFYAVEDKPLGTGGGVRYAMEQMDTDHVFVFNGDTFLDLEVADVELQWSIQHRPLIVGREVQHADRYGRLLVKGQMVEGFAEKGAIGPGLINAGCYVFNRNQLDLYPLGLEFSLEKDYLARAVADREIDVFITRGIFIDIGVPDDFLSAQNILAHY